jgi:ATP-binding cassette subfamily B protein
MYNIFTIKQSAFGYIMLFIRKRPVMFMALLLAPATIIIESNIIPYGLKLLIDIVSQSSSISPRGRSAEHLYYPFVIIVGGWLIKNIILRLCYYWETEVIPKFQSEIRLYSFKHVVGHSYNFFLNHLSGEVADKINNLPNSCENIRQLIYWNGLSSILTVSVSSIMLSTINYIFSILIIGWIFIHIFIVYLFNKKIRRAAQVHAEDQSLLSGYIVDSLSNVISVKSFSNSNNVKHILQAQDSEVKSHSSMMKKILYFQLASDFPIFLLLLFTIYFLIRGWVNNQISPGDFVLIFNIVIAVIYNIVGLGHVLTDIFRELGRINQSLSILMNKKYTSSYNDNKELKVMQGEIKFINVNFNYENNRPIFRDLNCIFPAGKKIGIIGESGSGKSTLLKLLMRFFEINSGQVEIDGQNTQDLSLTSLYQNIGYMSQEVRLFHCSIKDNISYGNSAATESDIIAVAKQALCHDFIVNLPEQYNTLVGEGGHKLSGGQKQRIALARVLLKDAKILILDEATSAQDLQTENFIHQSIFSANSNKTLIIISHKLPTFLLMDKILILHEGKIIQQGTHQQLLFQSKYYSDKWKEYYKENL